MNPAQLPAIDLGPAALQPPQGAARGEFVQLDGQTFYRIENVDAMRPFFISLASSSDHWLFIATTGGLTAGRVSAEQALFPYYTEDKLTENSENTGSRILLLVEQAGRASLWEPFSQRYAGLYRTQRNLYKDISGTALIFEEINLTLGLACRYAWRASETYGWVKTTWLQNLGEAVCRAQVLDGLQNLLPANVSSQTQNIFSPLLDAYKRSELLPDAGLGLFYLNSTLTDLAEPSESLLATTAGQVGLKPVACLLSVRQLEDFRAGRGLHTETEVRGQRGAYFVQASLELAPGAEQSWHLFMEVSQDAAAIVRLRRQLVDDPAGLRTALEEDLARNRRALEQIVAGADGLQTSRLPMHSAHHFANTMFNLMRGGVFADQYRLSGTDFKDFVAVRSRATLAGQAGFFAALPEELTLDDLRARAAASGEPDLIRLSYAYLPLSFSRRHGDPSRPWNRFSISLKKEDGSKKLDYEGNWRDIFQNWEALAHAYPEYVENMIFTFLSATTADGYNPYRVTRQGLDWEIPEPGNPWANIGYWSDHQVIYLQKLMEVSTRLHPGRLQAWLNQPIFTYADVPYRIKPYDSLVQDPYNTIQFDWELERKIEARVKAAGTDGKLLPARQGGLACGALGEKLLSLLLAKLVNFVPEGGIWMNTQRPEWNDANNALVGKGLSVVTLGYLRRFVAFWMQAFRERDLPALRLDADIEGLYRRIAAILMEYQACLTTGFSNGQRRAMMDALGQAGSQYREAIYTRGLSGEITQVPTAGLADFLDLVLRYLDQSLRANRRPDHLFHAYNILRLEEGSAAIGRLVEMLEGQVAILSSGLLNGAESLELLQSLRRSRLYRADQHTYILYPDRDLPGFLEKNSLAPESLTGLKLPAALAAAGERSLFTRDVEGKFHFGGRLRNLKDVDAALNALGRQPAYAGLVQAEAGRIRNLFEAAFRHDEFTGRSGTFFAYEGLGSIYWHMVSKLLLAVQETILRTPGEAAQADLRMFYRDLRLGQCFNKPPALYGAFPSDPYSHTPAGQGARQPGMTGMVKEEILARQAELGLRLADGRLSFDFCLLEREEFLSAPAAFNYLDVAGQEQRLELPAAALAFTFCQVPVILRQSAQAWLDVHLEDGRVETLPGLALDADTSRHIFQRDGAVHHLVVGVPPL